MGKKFELLVVLVAVALGIAFFLRIEEEPNPEKPAASPARATPIAVRTLTPTGELAVLPDERITESETVVMETDKGNLTIEVYPEAAPRAAARFLELVDLGFYDQTPIFRVVKTPKPFVAQFGINPKHKEWKSNNFDDEPAHYKLDRGTLAFAKAGPNTNSTQIFINYGDNDYLIEMGFTPFARVTAGMEVADEFAEVGKKGMGLNQNLLWNDPDYLKGLDEKPTMIVKASRQE